MEHKLKVEKNTQFTRCPTCKTAFRVSEQLLAKAAGKVRCGACLEIFQATDFLLKPSSNTQTHMKPIDESVPNNQAQTNSTTMVRNMVEESLSSNETEESNADSLVDQPKPERKPTIEFDASIRNNPFERLIPSEADLADEEIDFESTDSKRQHRDDVDFDEWVDEEFDEKNEIAKEDAEISDELLDFNEIEKHDESISKLTQEVDELLDFAEAPNSEEPEQSNPAVTEAANQQPQEIKVEPQKTADYVENDVYEHDIFEDDSFEHPLNSDGQPDLGQTQSIFFDESMLDNFSDPDESDEQNKTSQADATEEDEEIISIEEYEAQMGIKYQLGNQLEDADYEPDPLDEFDSVVEDYPSGLRSKMIMAASVLLVIILLSQIWSNRQAIAWNDTWGGVMKGVCVLLPCDLKPQRDISKIKLLQRQVSPDEEIEETLDIKVMFVNQAKFAQPYPNIKIIFSDSNNNPVTTKIFKPTDYLKDSQQDELMPVNTEVHIEFKTDLEYPDALGFEFIFE